MTSFERRQRILGLLREQSGIKVSELAARLGVSEATIRNDLNALEEEGELTRVRGGAVPREDYPLTSAAFAARVRVNAEAKQWIARRAAELVQDGDSILLDASTTVFAMVPYLQDCRNLTVVTNGIEVGLALARNPSHTVIMVGGALRPDGTSVVGHLGEKLLDSLHVRTAFVSSSGFSPEAGLTEVDIYEVDLKQKMIRCAEQVVALIDSSKFGKVDLTVFASLRQVSHILTDRAVKPQYVEQLRQACVALTVCGENTVSSYAPCDTDSQHYKIGFANLGESMAFPVDVRRGLEQAVKHASNIDLLVADNRLSGEVALQVADRLIGDQVDLAIEYQIDEKVGSLIMNKFQQAGIPVIAVDIPIVGATYFGVDHYRAGHMAGVALGQWVRTHWNGSFDRLIILEEQRPGALPAARIQGQLDGLQEVSGPVIKSRILYLDSGNTAEISQARMLEALARLRDEHRLAVISFNDDAAYGALTAARQAGRETDVAIVGQGADRIVRQEIRHPESRLIGSTAYWPEQYGQRLLEVALKILKGEPVPPAVYNQHIFITRHNIDDYYPVLPEGLAVEASSWVAAAA